LKHIAQYEDDGETTALHPASTQCHACNQAILVHAVEAAAPGSLSLADHPSARPVRQLEALGNHLERVIEIAYKGRPTPAAPHGLTAAAAPVGGPVMAQDPVGHLVAPDKSAGLIIVREQLGHVAQHSIPAFRAAGKGSRALAAVPAFRLGPASVKARQPRCA